MSETAELLAVLPRPWYRILAVPAPVRVGSPESDFVAVLPAALSAAQRGQPFVVGWLSRGGGAPLELITNAGPLASPCGVDQLTAQTTPSARAPGPEQSRSPWHAAGPSAGLSPSQLTGMLFPNGARGTVITDSWLRDADRLVWTPCAGRQAPPLAGNDGREPPQDARQPTLFETTLVTLMDRPFGWLIVAEPTQLLDAEMAQLRTQLTASRRFEEERARLDVERAERRIQELEAFCEAGLWNVRVLAGAATPAELRRVAPVLIGSVDLTRHPYRLRCGLEARSLADALAAHLCDCANGAHDRGDGAHDRGDGAHDRGDGAHDRGDGAHDRGHGARDRGDGARDHGDGARDRGHGAHDRGDGARDRGHGGYSSARVARDCGDNAHGSGQRARVPFPATAGAIAVLAGLPRREVPGLRVLDSGYFDVTSETDGAADHRPAVPEMIDLGAILDGQDRPVGTFHVPLATLNRHAFVTGATGAGKSQTVRHLLEGLTRARLPWLAIEPAKSEYAAMAGRVEGIAQVTVINPTDPQAIPLSVNPLAPEPGYPVQAHIDMVRALFQAAFDAEEPFPQVMSQALQRVYEANGWDVVTGGGVPGAYAVPAVPTLAQLQRTAIEVVEDVGYGKELQADVRGFVDVRLRSLRIGSAGRFFEGGHPADISELLRRNVVLAIEDVANDEDKAFLMGTLIIRIVEHLRLRARREKAAGLRHVIVIEEAHRLLRNRGQERSSSHAVELFAGMLAEIRAYGEGIVVAEQIPTKLLPDVVKNTALKVVHRLPAHDDRELVGAAMNLDREQSRQVVSLEPGIAAVFADGMDRPLRVRIPLGERRERVLAGPAPPITGSRSAACGRLCRYGRACSLIELRTAELMSASQEEAWLRIWAETLVLAFLTNHAIPAAPEPVRRRWAGFESEQRLRECVLATVIDRAVSARATSLRESYDPCQLMDSVANTALRILDGTIDLVGGRAGAAWVIPQLRWVHEIEQAFAAPSPFSQAPDLTYDLRIADGPGVTAEDRLDHLARHPLSMELERNRLPAWNALVGSDEHKAFFGDIDTVLIGVNGRERAAEAARCMRANWLLRVLSWPGRFMVDRVDEGAPDDLPSGPAVRVPEPRVKQGLVSVRPPGSRGRGRRSTGSP